MMNDGASLLVDGQQAIPMDDVDVDAWWMEDAETGGSAN
jgi:hypothetical protein